MRFTLIRGLSRDRYHWHHFPEQLRVAFPGCELEFLDLPGNGRFHSQMSPTSPETYLEFLRGQSLFVQQRRPTSVIAVSLAAMIAHDWSQTYPEEISSLLLFNTSLAPTPIYRRMRPTGLIRLLEAAKAPNPFLREKKILELTTCLLGPRLESLASEWAEHSRHQRTRPLSVMTQLLTAIKLKRQPKGPAVPCAIFSSANDALVHSQCSLDLAKAWQVPHFTHPSAGHDLTLDDPDWVIEKMKFFYDKTPSYDIASPR